MKATLNRTTVDSSSGLEEGAFMGGGVVRHCVNFTPAEVARSTVKGDKKSATNEVGWVKVYCSCGF